MTLESIRAFVPVTSKISTAGQPSEEQLTLLADNQYEVIINLGLLDARYCLNDEAFSVKELGMTYYHIPVQFSEPTSRDLQLFFNVMRENRNRKVFVHCAANYRVSCFMALYAQAHMGWSEEQAEAYIAKVWSPDAIWRNFINENTILPTIID